VAAARGERARELGAEIERPAARARELAVAGARVVEVAAIERELGEAAEDLVPRGAGARALERLAVAGAGAFGVARLGERARDRRAREGVGPAERDRRLVVHDRVGVARAPPREVPEDHPRRVAAVGRELRLERVGVAVSRAHELDEAIEREAVGGLALEDAAVSRDEQRVAAALGRGLGRARRPRAAPRPGTRPPRGLPRQPPLFLGRGFLGPRRRRGREHQGEEESRAKAHRRSMRPAGRARDSIRGRSRATCRRSAAAGSAARARTGSGT
jgi:hypothetical protein